MKRIWLFLLSQPILRIIILILALYIFILGIQMMGAGFKTAFKDYSEQLLKVISDPLSSFFIGLLVTSILQSSSLTTSILVSLCAAGLLPVRMTIPAIMGANIGTAITNTLVAFAYITRKEEFRRAFSGSLIHDYFNIFGCLIFLPLEIIFHPLEKTALLFKSIFVGVGGVKIASPIDFLTKPFLNLFKNLIPWQPEIIFIILGLVILFFSLKIIAKIMRRIMSGKMERIVRDHAFANPRKSFLLGLGLTSTIQSSSITTSLLIPLQAAGILRLGRVLPYTVGANIGTTVTAILASLAITVPAGVHLAFTHLFFNVFTALVIFSFKPLKNLIILLAKKSGDLVVESKLGAFLMIGGYLIGTSYFLPILYLLLRGLL